ncbi:MAG: hypothetical protein RPR40_01240 [Bermanella sp.]
MKGIMARILIIMTMLAAAAAQGVQLKLGVDPVTSPSIMRSELSPLLKSMRGKYALSYVPSSSIEETLQQVKSGEINCAYASLGYAHLFQALGFVPLLVSKEVVYQSLIGKPEFDFPMDENSSEQDIYYGKNDLYAQYRVQQGTKKFKWAANPIPSMTSENIIFKVLKEPASLGIIMGDELGLLHETMRRHIKVYETEEIGPIYFLVDKNLSLNMAEIKKDFLAFHKGFKDVDGQYNYLSLYSFSESVNGKLKGNPGFERFLKRFQ